MATPVGGLPLSNDDRYRVVARLGHGTSGEVFLVEDSAELPRKKH